MVYGSGARHARRQRRLYQRQGVSVHLRFVSASSRLAGRLSFSRLGRQSRRLDVRNQRELRFRRDAAQSAWTVLFHPRRLLGIRSAVLSFPYAVLGAHERLFEILRASVVPAQPGNVAGGNCDYLSCRAVRCRAVGQPKGSDDNGVRFGKTNLLDQPRRRLY